MKVKFNVKHILLLSSAFVFIVNAYAQAPVVDATPSGIYDNQPTMPVASPTVNNRVQSLEQEVKKLNQKLSSLQQTNEDLTNLVSMQSRQIAGLQKQKSYMVSQHRIFHKEAANKVANDKVTKKPVAAQNNNFPPALKSMPAQKKPSTKNASPQPKMVIIGKNKAQPVKKTIEKTVEHDGDVKLYQQAYGLVKAQKYSQAIPLLQQYVDQYPTGHDAGDAYYWLGQLQMIAGNGDKAVDAYTMLVNHYPHTQHVPDAMLQLAAAASSQQQWTTAKQWLQKIMIAYPNSAGARLAKVRLQQLQQAGH